MAFVSTSFRQAVDGSLSNGKGSVWHYHSTADSSATVVGAGYFAGIMRGSRGNGGMGPSVGDLLICSFGSSTVRWGLFSASTADQASTSASSGWGASYNGTATLT